MGFREVSSLDADVTVALGKKDKTTGKPYPKQAEGYFLGSRTVDNKRGESKLHFLQTSAGNLGVWGTTDLNRKLGSVAPGTMVRITSTGTKPTPNGDMYVYKVEVDADNTIDVAELSAGSSTAGTESAVEGYEEETYDNDEEDNSDVLATQAAAAAERQRKVQELLKGKGKAAKN